MPTIIEKAGAQSGDAPFTFVLSDESVDRMGDVVVQAGISLASFRKNPVALFAHSARQPIGTWENIRREGNALRADLKLAKPGTSRVIDELRSLIEQRILRAASIGFGVQKSEPMDPEQPWGPQRYTKTELLEASLVAVPANPNALAVRALSPESRALFFIEAEGTRPSAAPVERTAAPARKPTAIGTGNMKSIAERIKEARARIEAIDKRVGELKAIAENAEEMNDDTAQEVADLTAERATTEKNVANLESLEQLIAKRAEPAAEVVAARRGAPGPHAKAEPKGQLVVRMALAHVFAHANRRDVVDVARVAFAHDPRVEAVCKTAVGIADTTTAGWAAELVRTDVQGFVEALQPLSVYAAVAGRSLVIDFGNAGHVSIPARTGANTDMAGAFVGENGVIPVKRTTLAATLLHRYKMAVISTLTKELARTSTPQAEELLRRFMLEDTAVALDNAFLDVNAAVAGVRPAGLLNGKAPATPTTGTATPLEKAIADLQGLMTALAAAGNGTRPVYLMNTAQRMALGTMYSAGTWMFQAELAQGRLMGVDIVASQNVPPKRVILVDAANLATALGSPEFDASDTTTLVMANADSTAPTHATSAADPTALGTAEQVPPDGGIHVTDSAQRAAGKIGEGSVAVSMFQQFGIALRTVLPISWGLVRTGSVQWVDNVGW